MKSTKKSDTINAALATLDAARAEAKAKHDALAAAAQEVARFPRGLRQHATHLQAKYDARQAEHAMRVAEHAVRVLLDAEEDLGVRGVGARLDEFEAERARLRAELAKVDADEAAVLAAHERAIGETAAARATTGLPEPFAPVRREFGSKSLRETIAARLAGPSAANLGSLRGEVERAWLDLAAHEKAVAEAKADEEEWKRQRAHEAKAAAKRAAERAAEDLAARQAAEAERAAAIAAARAGG